MRVVNRVDGDLALEARCRRLVLGGVLLQRAVAYVLAAALQASSCFPLCLLRCQRGFDLHKALLPGLRAENARLFSDARGVSLKSAATGSLKSAFFDKNSFGLA